jgi:hypothetical protein
VSWPPTGSLFDSKKPFFFKLGQTGGNDTSCTTDILSPQPVVKVKPCLFMLKPSSIKPGEKLEVYSFNKVLKAELLF